MKEKLSYRPYPGALLNPKVDPIFKTLFTDNSDDAKLALESFLSAIFGKTVSDVELLPNEMSVETSLDKQSQFDLTCKFDDEYVNIEMQGRNQYNSYGKRAEYHVAHLFNHYVRKGVAWKYSPKVYQISVMNFTYDDNNSKGITFYKMRDEDGNTLDERLNVVFIELTKIIRQIEKMSDNDPRKLTTLQRWSKFFMDADKPEQQDYIKKVCEIEDGIMHAQKVLSKISQDEINWYKENQYWDNIANYNTIVAEAQDIGLKKGMVQGQNNLIKTLFQNGMTAMDISSFTKISQENIEKILSES